MIDTTPVHALFTVLVGVLTGVLSAAFGVGGAVISTPAIRLLGVSAAVAIGTTLPSIIPSAVTGTARYARAGLILPRVVLWTAPPGIVAAVGGSLLSKVIPGEGHWLMVLTAGLLGFTALRMARRDHRAPAPPAAAGAAPRAAAEAPAPPAAAGLAPPALAEAEYAVAPAEPPAATPVTRPVVLVAIGALAGLLSGLLGVGGGVVLVPAFSEIARIPLKAAIATSLACVALFAVPGTVTHAALGGIDWDVALLLSLGVVPGARLGAVAAIAASDARLRAAVAGFLGLVAVAYAAGEVLALMR